MHIHFKVNNSFNYPHRAPLPPTEPHLRSVPGPERVLIEPLGKLVFLPIESDRRDGTRRCLQRVLSSPFRLQVWRVPANRSRVRDTSLVLAFVSRARCRIAVNYPPLWSTIIIDRSDDEYLELFLDRPGKELLDIILLDTLTPTAHIEGLLIDHAHHLKSLVGHSEEPELIGGTPIGTPRYPL